MFWIVFAVIFCLPGAWWAMRNKEDPSFRYRWSTDRFNIAQTISTISRPLGYLFILFSPFSILVKVFIFIAVHFLILPSIYGILYGIIRKKGIKKVIKDKT